MGGDAVEVAADEAGRSAVGGRAIALDRGGVNPLGDNVAGSAVLPATAEEELSGVGPAASGRGVGKAVVHGYFLQKQTKETKEDGTADVHAGRGGAWAAF